MLFLVPLYELSDADEAGCCVDAAYGVTVSATAAPTPDHAMQLLYMIMYEHGLQTDR